MDVNSFGVNEYRKGTELTTSLFRQLFLLSDQKRFKQKQKVQLMPPQQLDEVFQVISGEEPKPPLVNPQDEETKEKLEEIKPPTD